MWGERHKIHIETANLGTRLGFKTPDISLLIIIIIIIILCVCGCARVCISVCACVRVTSFLILLAFCLIAELMDSSCTLWTSQHF